MTYTVRITGPGIDHTALITGAEDVEAARAVLDKIERDLDWKTIMQAASQASGGGEHG